MFLNLKELKNKVINYCEDGSEALDVRSKFSEMRLHERSKLRSKKVTC